MMELGATICLPKSPQCLLCPVAPFCEGRKLGIAEDLPEKRKKRATIQVTLAAAVFADKNCRTLLLPPPPDKNEESLADLVPIIVSRLWHFPTISVNGDPASKLRAFLKKFMQRGRTANWKLSPAARVRHSVTYRAITIFPFRINLKKFPRIPGAKIVPLREISALPVSNLTRKVAQAAEAAAIPHVKKR